MKKTLIIVESPTKAKTISRFLGSECTIIASKGHVRSLPKIGMAIDIANNYEPEYIIDKDKAKVISEIKAAMKNADKLILATDEDREGESISWHLVQILNPKIPYSRMVFHEITKKAILEAFENGRPIDMNLVHAQEARRILDRLYGYTISPVLWSKLSNKTLSAGRVQSPGLKLIVDRERLRMSFKKANYWDIRVKFDEGFTAKLESTGGKKVADSSGFDSETGQFVGSSKMRLLSFEDAQIIVNTIKNSEFTVSQVKEKTFSTQPAAPFMTSTLQQEGNRKLHLSAKDTMKIAQSLYEKGFITYMRTDSLILSDEGINAARNCVQSLYGKSYLTDSPRHYTSKAVNAQEAHEAIRPAGEVFVLPEESKLTGRELALYTLIFKRTLACQMKDAKKVSTTVNITVNDDVFTATGTRIEFPGFIKVYVEGTDETDDTEQTVLPKLEKDMVLHTKEISPQEHETREPSRYTEASLVKELEKREIGRPSTYASIIDRILEKQYVVKDNGSLVPTFTGFGVINLLEHFEQYIDYGFTVKMEQDLDLIAKGKVDKLAYLKQFYEGESGLEQQVRLIKDSIIPMDVKRIVLPQISEENTVTIGKFGPYIQDKDGKYYSVPDKLYPCDITEKDIDNIMHRQSGPQTPIVGTSPEGLPILYCTGKFGDYWQIGDKAKKDDVRRFKIPRALLGKDVPSSRIMEFFNLPRIVGTTEDGTEITSDIGKYGPYIKCGDDFRTLKDIEDVFSVTELEARQILSMQKPEKKTAKTTTTTVKRAKTETASSVVKDFGIYEGDKLDIRSGRYGFYIRYGAKNVRIAEKYQHDEEACKAMTLEEAVTFLKK